VSTPARRPLRTNKKSSAFRRGIFLIFSRHKRLDNVAEMSFFAFPVDLPSTAKINLFAAFVFFEFQRQRRFCVE
jgi:hypothetical protein